MATKRVRRLVNGDMTFGRSRANYAQTSEATAQRVVTRLRMNLGEERLDTSYGVPYWQPPDSDVKAIMGGPKDLGYTEATLKRWILGSDGVKTLDSFSMTFNPQTRHLSIACSGTTVDGDVWTIRETIG